MSEQQWKQNRETVDPPKQGPLDQGDKEQPKHDEPEKVAPIVPSDV